jgi:uncharacterized protein
MEISMYRLSVPVFDRYLSNLSAILGKGAAFAEEKKIDETVLTGMRLAPDMFPLSRQVQIAGDFAKGACARLAGVEVPKYEDSEKTFADLQARCKKTQDFIKSLTPEQLEGSEKRIVTISIRGNNTEFVGLPYLTAYAFPHFYFHVTTAYNVLRHAGVPVGKTDFIGAQ